MKKLKSITLFSFLFTLFSLTLTGCGTARQLAGNMEDKAVTLNGTFSMNKIVSMDAVNKSPTVLSLIGWGNYTSVPNGMEFIQYRETEDSSIFNSSSKSTSIFFLFASPEKKRADDVISAISERLKPNPAE